MNDEPISKSRLKREAVMRGEPLPGCDLSLDQTLDAIDSALTLLSQQQQASKVWTELTVILSCTSPDGSVELSMVRDLLDTREQQQQAIARLTEARPETETACLLKDWEILAGLRAIVEAMGAPDDAMGAARAADCAITELLRREAEIQSLTSRLEAKDQEIATLKQQIASILPHRYDGGAEPRAGTFPCFYCGGTLDSQQHTDRCVWLQSVRR